MSKQRTSRRIEDEAVSPVIATILMVAITVVLAGTLYVWAANLAESNTDGSVQIENLNFLKDSDGRNVVIGRTTVINVIDQNGIERASHKLPYGSQLLVDDGEKVKKNQRLAQWDPYTIPIITEASGIVAFEDLVDGVSIGEVSDESTGISQKVVIDWKNSSKSGELKPSMVIKGADGNIVTLESNREARYLMSVDAIISASDGTKVGAGDVIARIPTEGAKTKYITGGLPRVAELFEARKPKEQAILAQESGIVSWGKPTKGKERLIITDEDGNENATLIPKTRHINVFEGERVEKGDIVSDGAMSPHDILALRGLEELTEYIVDGIQEVYRLQGVSINDKHIEVILNQMLRKVVITDPGDSELILGEQAEFSKVREINLSLREAKKAEIKFDRILLGITKASLATESFISAASFQETTRVLTEAATTGRVDHLRGLKENVVVGRLIPAGSGLAKLNSEVENVEEEFEIDLEKALSDALNEAE